MGITAVLGHIAWVIFVAVIVGMGLTVTVKLFAGLLTHPLAFFTVIVPL